MRKTAAIVDSVDVCLDRYAGRGFVEGKMADWFRQNYQLVKSFAPKLTIWYLLLFIVWLILLFKGEWIDAQGAVAEDLRDQLQHVILLVLIFYLVYDTVTTTAFVNHIRDTVLGKIVDLLAGNRAMFDNLSAATKERYVVNSIQSTLGDEFGNAVIDEIVRPHLRRLVPYRKNFRYKIAALEIAPNFAGIAHENCRKMIQKLTPENGYFWLNQYFRYSRRGSHLPGPEKGPFLLAITFDSFELQQLLPQHDMFFREIIEFDDELKAIAKNFSKDEADEFVRKVLGLAVSEIAGLERSVEYQVTVENPGSQKLFIKITTSQLPEDSISGGIAISFNTPKSSEAPWFITSLPQPCERPVISFRKNAHMTQLEPVLFMSNLQPGKIAVERYPKGSTDPDECEVTVDGWTFPTNGVMFTWRYRGNPAGAKAGSGASRGP
jgi:hypothetical protein